MDLLENRVGELETDLSDANLRAQAAEDDLRVLACNSYYPA